MGNPRNLTKIKFVVTFYHLLSGNGDGSSGDRITPETDPQEGTSRKSNATDATAEDRLMIVDEDEHEEGSGPSDAEQPVDFSAGSSGGAYKPRYSILSKSVVISQKTMKRTS